MDLGYASSKMESAQPMLNAVGSKVTEDFKKISSWAKEGPTSIKFLAFCGGTAMMINAGLKIFYKILTFSPFDAMIQCYIMLFGMITILCEAKQILCPKLLRQMISKYAHFLDYLTGRGLFYIFIGSFLITRWPNIIDFGLGAYIAGLGVISLMVGKTASKKLQSLREQLINEEEVKKVFQGHDLDVNGALDNMELKSLCEQLGVQLTDIELEAALQIMDIDNNGNISYEEFLSWWKSTGVSKGILNASLNYGLFQSSTSQNHI